MQCKMFNTVFVVLTIFVCVDSRGRPASHLNFVTPCGRNPNCLTNAIRAGLPGFLQGNQRIGTERLDPFEVKKLDLDLPGGLKVKFYDGYAKGLSKCNVDSARIVADNFDIQYHCNLTVKGKYKSSGQLMMFQINGDGDAMIKCRNLKVRTTARLSSVIGADGEEYLEFLNIKNEHSFDGQVLYRFSNIFKGNPQLSKAIVNFMNSNWRLVAEEFGKPVIDFGVDIVVRNVKKLFAVLPLNYITSGYEFN